MYVRFIVRRQDPYSHWWTGLFTVAYDLFDTENLDEHLKAELSHHIAWFRRELRVPGCLGDYENDRAICWFRAEAKQMVRRAWELSAVLREAGEPIEMVRTANPGSVLYEDRHQVVAKPRKEDRIRSRVGRG